MLKDRAMRTKGSLSSRWLALVFNSCEMGACLNDRFK